MTVITHTEQPGPAGSGLARYRDALRTPGVLGFAIPGVVGRMPMAMLSLALVMLLAAVTGSYGIAGAVSAAGALAYAAVTRTRPGWPTATGRPGCCAPRCSSSPPLRPRWRPAL